MLSRSSTFEGWILPTALMACEVCALECDYHLDAFIQECARACHAVREAADRVSETEDTARTAADGRFNQVQASP